MMIDLMVLAAQADLTRVNTLMLAREVSGRSYPEIDVPDAHHPMSHHGNDPEKIAKLTKINTLHMEQVAYYLKRMGETKDGNGTLLDNTLLLAGASLADPNKHSHKDLPTIVAGGADRGQPPPGRGEGHADDQPDAVDDGSAGRQGREAGRLDRPADRIHGVICTRISSDEQGIRIWFSASGQRSPGHWLGGRAGGQPPARGGAQQ